MASQNRIEKMRVAVRGWIENRVPDGIKLSLWKFTNVAMEIKSTIIGNNSMSRQEIMNSIPEIEGGSSCIGCAIETILKQVNKKFTLLLITDGNDKFLEQDLKDLNAKIKASQCKIIAILIGNSLANIHLLQELSDRSVSHVTDTNTVLGLLDTLQSALQIVKNLSAPINIFEEEFSTSETDFNATFTVDSTVAQKVCIDFYYWPYTMPLLVDLTTPKGVNQQIPNMHSASGYMQYCLLPGTVGEWKVHTFSSTFNKFLALQVTATKNVMDLESDITLSCWIEIGKSYSSICGTIHSGKYLINDTKMRVDILTQEGEIIKQDLLEIYSGNNQNYHKQNLFVRKHLNITQPGYYSARCWAAGQFLQAPSIITKPQQFTRVIWTGTFQMEKFYNRLTIPSEITDLLVAVESLDRKCSIIMEFTVPNKAVKYKVLISPLLHDIISVEGMILSTVPGNEGTKEKITFQIPSRYFSITPLYIALSAIGDKGVEGEISNVVPIVCHTNHKEESTSEATHQFTGTSVSIQVTPEYNLSTQFTSYENSSSIELQPDHTFNNSLTTPKSIFNTEKLPQEHKENISNVTEVSSSTSKEFSSNTSDTWSNSSTTVTIKNINYQRRDTLGPAGIVGIVALVLLIIASASAIIYQNIRNRKRSKYEIASKDTQSSHPFNDHEDL